MRSGRAVLGAVGMIVCLAAGASVALGASSSATPKGGAIHIFVMPGNGQGNGKIIITGAIGDYGSSSPVSTGAKKYGKATLTKGTITFDLTAITKKVESANPTVNLATCSASITKSATAPIVDGTGVYAGIHGSVKITESFGFIGSTIKSGPKKGQCNQSSSAPTVAETGIVYGKGHVSF